MPGPILNAEELAEELGRTKSWLYEHWRELVSEKRLPPPLLGGAMPLTWDRAQFYAFKDRTLTRPEQVAAAAYRAARDAADNSRVVATRSRRVVSDASALDAKFHGEI